MTINVWQIANKQYKLLHNIHRKFNSEKTSVNNKCESEKFD